MKLKFLTIALLLTLSAQSQEFTVLTEATSLRKEPNGEIIGTLSKGYYQELNGRFKFWGKGEKGWINLDFTRYSQPTFLRTGKLTLKLFKLYEDAKGKTDNGEIAIPLNSILLVSKELKDSVIGYYKGKMVMVNKGLGEVERVNFELATTTKTVTLTNINTGERKTVPSGTPILLFPNGKVFYKGQIFSAEEENSLKTAVDLEKVLNNLNRLIDIYNSAKFSSPIADRLGYYVKTLPLKREDIELIETPNGTAIRLNLKHKFYTTEGKSIRDRKTRLILKKSNFEFWNKLAKSCFENGINKFVEIEISRYEPEKGYFSNEGFISFSYHFYKRGNYNSYDNILKFSDSDLKDDLWFFADEVYERIENGN